MYSDNAAQKIKTSLYSPYHAQACNYWRGPPPRRSAWATQLRTNVATVASRWRLCDDLADPAIEPHTSRTDRVGLATELIGRHSATQVLNLTQIGKSVLCFLLKRTKLWSKKKKILRRFPPRNYYYFNTHCKEHEITLHMIIVKCVAKCYKHHQNDFEPDRKTKKISCFLPKRQKLRSNQNTIVTFSDKKLTNFQSSLQRV